MQKLTVGILGATGMVGQRFIQLLDGHPWFEVVAVAASERSAGKKYKEAASWTLDTAMPARIADLTVKKCDPSEMHCDFVFSALDSNIAGPIEESFASSDIPVISTSKDHRWDKDVPMIIPEVNADHLRIIDVQRKNRGWKKGFIAVKSNCSLQSYVLALYPLHRKYRMTHLILSTMQALSGAGYPGVPSLDIVDNVVPYIGGEEEKSEEETLKILGQIEGEEIVNASDIRISAHCNRVPVLDGHLAAISVQFEEKPSEEDILRLWKEFRGQPQELGLPSAPDPVIVYHEQNNRPQPRLDRDLGHGMTISCGRLRPCHVFDWRFLCLSHNTIRGAAGGAILTAELLKAKGYI